MFENLTSRLLTTSLVLSNLALVNNGLPGGTHIPGNVCKWSPLLVRSILPSPDSRITAAPTSIPLFIVTSGSPSIAS